MADKSDPSTVLKVQQVFSVSEVNKSLNAGWIYLGMYVERKLRNQGEENAYVEEEAVFVLGLPKAVD